MFDGYITNTEGLTAIKNGYISPNHIKFSTTTNSGKNLQYEGHYSLTKAIYIGASFYKKGSHMSIDNFTLQNQKLQFEPPTNKKPSRPVSPFFLYKLETFQSVSQLNPGLKVSQINALITEKWNSFDGPIKRYL